MYTRHTRHRDVKLANVSNRIHFLSSSQNTRQKKRDETIGILRTYLPTCVFVPTVYEVTK